MKNLVLMIVALVTSSQLMAQQEAMFTHYSFNTLAVNPGYAGSRDALTVTGLHRSQWVDFDGAPRTNTVTLHTPIANEKIGLGLTLFNDKIGPTKSNAVFVDFAYKIPVGAGKLAFGIKAGINQVGNNITDLTPIDEGDLILGANQVSQVLPNVGFGMYYSTRSFYAGISTPRLLENDFKTNTVTQATEQRHYYFIAGTVFSIAKKQNIKLRPTALLKVTQAAPVELDLTALFYFNDKFWAGPMFRTGDAVGVLAGLNLTDQFAFGYSFDWSYANSTTKYNYGSHELMLRYDFIYNNTQRIRSPRYF
ncbi:MAG: type IX secretion system membrane protein PorP/SprF [Putridiphycobacter sp.]|nr:type IX secretion system membrane protein PorP/SprF [Putridiphycobacter sp.]